MADVVIESGMAQTGLTITGSQRSPIAEQFLVPESSSSAPALSDALTGTIQDTVSISSAAQKLGAGQMTAATLSASNQNFAKPATSRNPFVKIYEQAMQLIDSDTETFAIRENYFDRISLSFEALSMSQE